MNTTVLSDIDVISNEDRLLLDKSILRINQISNDLLMGSKTINSPHEDCQRLPKIVRSNLNQLIDEIVKEKISEYKNIKSLRISFSQPEEEFFSLVDDIEFKRLLSNIINNSIEAHGDSTGPIIVKISLEKNQLNTIITITDNGKGIPPEIIKKIGTMEFTTKKNGNGLGLMHTFESVRAWDGETIVKSEPGKGTSIQIILPLHSQEKNITLLFDDDELVRLTWESSAKKKKIDFIAVSNLTDFKNALATLSKNSTIYIDSQLGGGVNGEDIAMEIHNQGYTEIYIASGFGAEHFNHLAFIKGTRNKSPPW